MLLWQPSLEVCALDLYIRKPSSLILTSTIYEQSYYLLFMGASMIHHPLFYEFKIYYLSRIQDPFQGGPLLAIKGFNLYGALLLKISPSAFIQAFSYAKINPRLVLKI